MPDWLTRYAKPREGWLALGLLFVMLLSLGWAVQRAEWLDRSDFLIPVAFYAIIAGSLLGLSTLSVVFTLPIGALLGTGVVLWAVGGEYLPDLGQLGRLLAMRGDVLDWVRIIVDRGYGPQLVPWAVGLGLVMWVTAFMAAYTIYRHHRVLDAILLVGAALIANMSATLTDLFGYLVLFMLAALLLWLRAALIGREEGWQRRRVNENVEVPAAIMRSGVLFIVGSITLAWMLTTVAVAAPLTSVWNNLDNTWTDVRDRLDGVFGGLSNPEARIRGTTFGSGFRISGSWVSNDAPVLAVASGRAYYLRTATYEDYTGHGFARGAVEERRVDGGQLLFPDGTPEQPLNPEAWRLETVHIQHQQSLSGAIFTPGYPVSILAPTVVLETGGQPILGGLESTTSIPPGSGYFVTALISTATESQLNAAGADYPELIRASYLATDGVTERTRALAEEIVAAEGAETPYEMAKALQAYFQTDPGFRYNTTAPLPSDPNRDVVDFFLFDENGKIGYCEYYATAMAVMARTLGIPSRVAVGYAPGDPVGGPAGRESGIYQVRERNAHAWAELYFPGYGWERFEATRSISPIVRRTGEPIEPGSGAGALPSLPPRLDPDDRGNISELQSVEPLPEGFGPGERGPAGESRGGNLLLISALALVGLGVLGWRLRRSRRRLRFLAPGERQWLRLALAADRAGVSQRPEETIYEYAGWLEEQIPTRRPEIRTIADGKVWQSYSGRGMTSQAIARIEMAWKRLELPLVWLAVKRRLAALLPRGHRA